METLPKTITSRCGLVLTRESCFDAQSFEPTYSAQFTGGYVTLVCHGDAVEARAVYDWYAVLIEPDPATLQEAADAITELLIGEGVILSRPT